MFEGTAILKKETISQDEYLNEIRTFTEKEVFVKEKSITRSEFYASASVGLTPSITLEMSMFDDYDDEKIVEYKGKTYSVIRTFKRPDSDALELILGEKKGNE